VIKGQIAILEKVMKRFAHFFKIAYLKIRKALNKIIQDEIPKEAAALTFVTVLSFVPFLMLIFFLIPEIPGVDIHELIKRLFLNVLLPDSAETGIAYISKVLENNMPYNIFNVSLLTVTSFTLFKFINSSFDKVLNAKELVTKGILYKIGKFVGMILFGFIFILVIFSSTTVSFVTHIFNFPIFRNLSFIIVPFILFFLVNSFIYFFATSLKIRAKSLILGSTLASLLWIIVKLGFDYYIANLTNMEAVWGVVSSIPIILFWIYLNWMIILLGVEFIAIIDKDEIMKVNTKKNL